MSRTTNFSDQAQGLRRISGEPVNKVIPFIANGARSDQAFVLTHFAAALQRRGSRVLIVDAGRCLIGAWLGMELRYDLVHWLNKECEFEAIIQASQEKLWVMPAARALERGQEQTSWLGQPTFAQELRQILASLTCFDVCIVVASASGLAALLGTWLNEAWMICSADAQAIRQAYQRIKTTHNLYQLTQLRMIYTQAVDVQHCEVAHQRLTKTVERSFPVGIKFAGAVPVDPLVRQSQLAQRTVFSFAPGSEMALTFDQIAAAANAKPELTWPLRSKKTRQLPPHSFGAAS